MERQQVAPGRQAEAQLTSLSLRDFRNYADCRVTIEASNVLLLGENGAGKTNLMEAVSLLAPGRGLRRARAEHLPRQSSGGEQWAVSAELRAAGEVIRVGTGVPADSDSGRRIMRRDGETVPQTEIGRLLSVSWLTPRMDGIFIDSPGARRRFLDRLVIAFDAAHIGRTNRYEKLLRERAALLAEGRADEAWCSAIEASLAESAIAVTAARQALIADLNAEAAAGWFDFPGVRLALDGTVEGWLAEGSALQAEDRFIAVARTRRMAGDTGLAGPHASDMTAVNSHTDAPAHLASTGQQKALLIAVVLAHARLQARRLGRPPLLLLDDVVAHLDVARRAALFEAVGAVGAQTWFSGTDHDDFEGLDAQSLSISADDGTASITQSEE
ncbi:MAG: DNA replication/repair protein RecF [Rhodobiaceae bacterium]|jgi:DNA replication and repair protein RecF